MADTKITVLTAITTVDPAVDVLPIVDVSDTTMAASGTTKKITSNQILGAGGTATLASATITGDLTVDTSTLKVDSTNNRVGVNTATPSYPFHVVTNSVAGRFNLSNIDRTTQNWSRITNPQFATDASAGLLLRPFPDSDARQGAGIIASGGTNNGDTNVALFVSSGVASSTSFAAYATSVSGSEVGHNWYTAAGSVGMTLNSTGLGIGVTPSAWNSNYNALDIGQNGCLAGRVGSSNTVDVASNGFRNSSGNWVYKLATSNAACRYQLDGSTGSHIWYSGAAGTAGNTISGFSAALMTLDSGGNLILQPPASPPSLGTNGQLVVNATSNTNLRFSYRGSDGVTRVANITLA